MATTAFPSRDDFAALLNESLGGENETFEGKVVKGIVTGIENDLAVIDVGLKSEGRVPLREFAAPGQKADLKVGDEVEVFVDRVENASGEAMLSRDRARREAAWDTLEKEHEAGNRVEGVIFGRVKGGFTVDLGGAVAFLPGSQVDIRPVRDVGPLMDMAQPFQILKMDRRRGNIVVSRRAILEETRAEQRSGLIQSLAEEQVIEGVVKNITDYGAFVDLGGIDGLLHVTDISYKRVNHPSRSDQHRRHGEGADHPHQPRDAAHQPWHEAAGNRSVGRRCRQISGRRRVPRPGDQHHRIWRVRRAGSRHRGPGPRLRNELDQEERPPGQDRQHFARKSTSRCSRSTRRSAGFRSASSRRRPIRGPSSPRPIRSARQVEGEVKNSTEFGLFIGLPGDVDGMVHMSDIAWGVSGEEALALHHKGETVKAVVLDVDVEKERISLGIKQLERGGVGVTTPGVGGSVKKNDVVTVTVLDVKDGGLDVQVGDDGPTGFAKRTDLGRDRDEQRPERFQVGQKFDAMVIGFDRSKKPNFSIKALQIAEEKQAVQQYGSSDSGASLGDILGEALKQKESAKK